MNITVAWHDHEETIIDMKFLAGWDWEQYIAAFGQVFALANSVSHPVYCVQTNDSVEAQRLPPGRPLGIIRNLAQQRPTNLSGVWVVSSMGFTRAIINIINTMNILGGMDVVAVADVGDALKQIEQHRAAH